MRFSSKKEKIIQKSFLKKGIFFSIYQLPESNSIRKKFLKFFLKKNKTLFFALEDIQLKSLNKIEELKQIYFISKNSIKLVK